MVSKPFIRTEVSAIILKLLYLAFMLKPEILVMTEEIENSWTEEKSNQPETDVQKEESLQQVSQSENTLTESGTNYSRIEKLFFVELKQKIRKVDSNLRSLITGKIVFDIPDQHERFLIDGSCSEIELSKCADIEGDCTIRINSGNLIAIEEGKLNPQIAMLSDKIHVKGDSNLALYVFNLFAPSLFR